MPQESKPQPHPATALFNKVRSKLENLSDRWADEHEYEDIKEYAKPFQDDIKASGATFLGMSKRPFGFKAQVNGKPWFFYASSTTVGYKPVNK